MTAWEELMLDEAEVLSLILTALDIYEG